MYAVVLTGGKQYNVAVGDCLEVEKLTDEVGATVELEVLMFVDGEKVLAGAEANAIKAKAEVVGHGKDKKIIIFKYKAKKNVRKKKGHRQSFTRIKIVSIA